MVQQPLPRKRELPGCSRLARFLSFRAQLLLCSSRNHNEAKCLRGQRGPLAAPAISLPSEGAQPVLFPVVSRARQKRVLKGLLPWSTGRVRGGPNERRTRRREHRDTARTHSFCKHKQRRRRKHAMRNHLDTKNLYRNTLIEYIIL